MDAGGGVENCCSRQALWGEAAISPAEFGMGGRSVDVVAATLSEQASWGGEGGEE